MYTVGSAGIVDPSDSGKVVCAGPVAQLGIGVSGLEPPVAGTEGALAARVTLPQTMATIRYPVPAEGPALSSALGLLGLVLRYRSGTGRVVATLLEVPVLYDELGDPGTVTERVLLQFDSASAAPSAAFRTVIARLPRASGLYGYLLQFGPNVYYVDLTLTGSAIVAGQPPAVAAIEIVGFQPPGPGSGYGDGGGSGGYDGGGGDDDDPGHDPD